MKRTKQSVFYRRELATKQKEKLRLLQNALEDSDSLLAELSQYVTREHEDQIVSQRSANTIALDY